MNQIRLFGPPQIERNHQNIVGEIAQKGVALLAYLYLERGIHRRNHMASLLWGDSPEPKARASLRTLLYDLQQRLPDLLIVERQTVTVHPNAPYHCDVWALQTGLNEDNVPARDQATTLYGGLLLQGLYLEDAPAFMEWLYQQQEQWRLQVLMTLEQLADHFQGGGKRRQAIRALRQLLTIEPWRETSHRHLMHLLARSGDLTAALKQYVVCRQLLRTELDVAPAPETAVLYNRIRAARERISLPLPAQPTPFLGRQSEINQLTQRLIQPHTRLITILGPGGVGKTRLALEVARQLDSTYLEGAVFVPLAESSPDNMLETIASALQLPLRGARPPLDRLIAFLAEKEMLLILDNFETLLPQGAAILAELVTQTRHLQLLVTSRQAAQLRWETTFVLSGLPYPIEKADRETPGIYPALQLFQLVAQRAVPDFELAANQTAVQQICRTVAGLPLGIELAAALINQEDCATLARQLQENLNHLTTNMHDVPVRQRSARAIFDHSWALLDATARDALLRLTIFRGGFTAEAARDVCRLTQFRLDDLVAKSWLKQETAVRYAIHPLLNQYAREKRAADWQRWATAHSHYYLALISDEKGKQQTVEPELLNIRSAWEWAVRQVDLPRLQQACQPLITFFNHRSLLREGLKTFSTSLEQLSGHPAMTDMMRYQLQIGIGYFHLYLSNYDSAHALLSDCLTFLRQTEPPQPNLVLMLLIELSHLSTFTGQYPAAKTYAEEALQLAVDLDNQRAQANALNLLGNVARDLGHYPAAADLYRQARAVEETAIILSNLGGALIELGQYDAAEAVLTQALAEFKQRKTAYHIARVLTELAFIAEIHDADFARAIALHEECMTIRYQIGDELGVAYSQNNLGVVYYNSGDPKQALPHYLEAMAIKERLGEKRFVGTAYSNLALTYATLGDLALAEKYLKLALQNAFQYERVSLVLDALFAAAVFCRAQGDVATAVSHLGWVYHHPTTEQDLRNRTTDQLRQLETAPPPAPVDFSLDALHNHVLAQTDFLD